MSTDTTAIGANPVTATPTPDPAEQARHFAVLLANETDCWDVHEALRTSPDDPGFVLLDVRGPQAFAAGHVPGATNLPHGRIVERNLGSRPRDRLFVTYCAGAHCNAADKAALRLAQLGRPVKKMLGGVTGWLDEGFALVDEVGAEFRSNPRAPTSTAEPQDASANTESRRPA